MTLQPPRPGAGWVQEYQVSGIPWVTASSFTNATHVDFDYVTRFFIIKNTCVSTSLNMLHVGFTALGVASSSHYFTLIPGESFSEDLRIKTLFVSGTGGGPYQYELIAGLTSVQQRDFPVISASLIVTDVTTSFPGVG
jgi:hypothetical protein